jgi:hypothetical protein
MRLTERETILMLVLTMLLALTFAGCGGSSDSNNCNAHTGTNVAFVTTSAFGGVGTYSTVDIGTLTAAEDLPGEDGIIEGDNAIAFYNDRIYIINRGTPSNITVLDKNTPCRALNQFSTGNGTNPYAMAFNSATEAYVLLYDSNDLLVVDPTAATDQITQRIDLSGFMAAGDPDELVEAGAMVKVNDYLFVALQRLNRNNFFAVENDAVLVVIDTTTNEIVDVDEGTAEVDAITLTGRNPQFMVYNETTGRIYVSETGSYGANDGGIEAVDPVAWEAEGFVVTEETLESDVGAVAIVDATKGYAVVGGFVPNKVVSFNPDTGAAGIELVTNIPFIPSLTLDDQARLLVPDRTESAPGLRIYDTSTDTEISEGAIGVGGLPNVILVY